MSRSSTSRYHRAGRKRLARRTATLREALRTTPRPLRVFVDRPLLVVSIPPGRAAPPPAEQLAAARAMPVGLWRHGYVKHARDQIRAERAAARRLEEVAR